MNRYEDLRVGGSADENPDKYSNRRSVGEDLKRNKERDRNGKAKSLDDIHSNGQSPKERLANIPDEIAEKLDPAVQEIRNAMNGQAEGVKQEMAIATLRELQKEMGQAGNVFQVAADLANETTPSGHSKKFQKENDRDAVREDDEYSRSGDANATNQKEKKRDRERVRNRPEDSRPNW